MKIFRVLIVLFLGLLALCGGVVAKIYLSQDHQIFPRTVNTIPAPNPSLSPFEHLAIPTPDGQTLNGILFPSKRPSPTLIIAFGGNAHDVVGLATFLKNDVFPHENVVTAGLSYRGYPNVLGIPSTGTPTEVLVKQDALTIYDTLQKQIHPARTYAIGYSLGSAVATHLALNRPLAGLIMVAPPASIRRMGQEKYPFLPVSLLIKYPFATEDVIAGVTVPTTIFYSNADGFIPAHHIEILHQHLPSAQVIELPGSTHGNILFNAQLPPHLRQLVATSPSQPLQP